MMGSMRRVAIMISLNWPIRHHHQVFAGIQRYAQECGHWDCVLNPYADLLLSDPAQTRSLDGIVARATPRLARLAGAAGIPVVNVWQNSPVRNLPSVFHDAEESGRMAARHLIARGFRAFAYLGYTGDRSSRGQSLGFHAAIDGIGGQCSDCWISNQYDESATQWRRFQDQLGRWMDGWQSPIGVLATNDLACRYVAEACRQRGLRIPHEVSLIGSSNELVVATVSHPTLTSIDHGFERVGHQAAALLDALMDGKPPPKVPLYLPPTSLVIRQSSDAFVVDDPMVSQALQFIADNVHRDINVELVAAHISTTRRTLSRRFDQCLGQTIHQAIVQMRLERVKRRLVETDATLKSVAAECGFSDAIHLCKVFQRVEGTSPSDYRATRTR